jgi:hypothetical protein
MAFTAECRHDGGVLAITVTGAFDVDAKIATMNDCYTRFDCNTVLWDYRRSDLSGFSADEFKKIADASAVFNDKRGPNARTVILTRTDPEAALARAFTGWAAALTPVSFFVTTDPDEAQRLVNRD